MKKRILILGLIMVMVLTGCSGSNKKETEKTEATESGAGVKYFNPIMEDINGDENSAVTAKFKPSTLTFQLILKDGKEIKDVEKAREVVLTYSKDFMEKTGKKGYKVEYVDGRNKKKPLIQAKDGEITIDTFEVMEITEENVKKLAEETLNKTARETDGNSENIKVTNVVIKDGTVKITAEEEIFILLIEKRTLNLNAAHIVDLAEILFKDDVVKEFKINMQHGIEDEKGNKNMENILTFSTNREKIAGVDWIGFREMVFNDYKKLLSIATEYRVETNKIK